MNQSPYLMGVVHDWDLNGKVSVFFHCLLGFVRFVFACFCGFLGCLLWVVFCLLGSRVGVYIVTMCVACQLKLDGLIKTMKQLCKHLSIN